MAIFRGVSVSTGTGVASLTFPVEVPSSMGTGSVGKVVASTGTPGVAVKKAGVANTHQPHQKSPPWVHPWRQKAPGYGVVYRKRLGLILENERKRI